MAPRELLSRVLLALLDAGDLALGDRPGGEGSTRCLVRLALRGFPDPAMRQALAASALVGLSQVLGLSTMAFLRAGWASHPSAQLPCYRSSL